MVDSAPRGGVGLLWSAFAAVRERADSDGDLVRRFALHRDEPAFAELVRRLGPTVYGVCRRILGNTADADDAFQAAFLVLSRKAGTIRPPGKVAAWVYGVASLCARKLRLSRHRRRLRERAARPPSPVTDPEMDSTLLPVVDEELARLPDKFRLPILLCGVRGLTTAAAAAELGWPVGTVASRLSRGRAELATRLATRGIALGVLAGGCELAAAVPPRLIESTLAAAGGDTLPPAVAALSSEVMNVMTWTPVRRLTAGLLCASVVGLAGGGLLVSPGVAAPIPAAPADAKATLDRVKLNDVSGLLRQEGVRKEVGLSEDDYKTLADFREGKQGEIQKAIQADVQAQIQAQGGGRNGGAISIRSNGELTARLTGEMNAEYAKKVGEVLKPDGVRRLKQAVLQQDGPRALLNRLVIRELQLTADQEDKLDAMLKPATGEVVMNDKVEKAAEDRDAEMAAALKVLTPEQRKKWDALVGKAFPTADLVKAHPLSEESMMDQMKQFRGGGGVQFAVPVRGVPLVPPAAPPPVEKK